MVTSHASAAGHRLAMQVRERFVDALEGAIVEVMALVQRELLLQAQGGGGVRGAGGLAQMHLAQDAAAAFQRQRQQWMQVARAGWRGGLADLDGGSAQATLPAALSLGLLDDEVVESKIVASRMAAIVLDGVGTEFNALRVRMLWLDGGSELSSRDVLRPETFAQQLLKAWSECELTRPMWQLVHMPVQNALVPRFDAAYRAANAVLVEHGVMAEINLKALVRRTDGSGPGGRDSVTGATHPADEPPATRHAPASRYGAAPQPGSGATGFGYGASAPQSGATRAPGASGASGAPGAPGASGPDGASRYEASRFAREDVQGSSGIGGVQPTRGPAAGGHGHGIQTRQAATSPYAAGTTAGPADSEYVRPSALARASGETRMMTGMGPVGRVRQRAQGVLGQLKRLLADRVVDFESAGGAAPSPQLAQALAEPVTPFAATEPADGVPLASAREGRATQPLPAVGAVATRLRTQATELKAKAEKQSEKATIEIVALMFQAILAEERIPAAVRVWFARLQMPVLRLALAEPDFFASLEHPARQLIDRMGACALGFDAGQIAGSRLEREIKRIVQVIEQYPETGRRVYQLVLEEFRKFLGRSLAEGAGAQQAATLAQQVEQKEALAIQYTIELRRMLQPVPVAEEVREFMFRVWSEVLAMAAVRRGAQAPETLRMKQAAADLIWAVSPKSDRAERSRVVQQLSRLIATLREGMSTLAMPSEDQDAQIKQVNDAVTKAFVSRAEGLSHESLAELARGLAGFEDVVSDDAEGDVLLDPGMIELMFGAEGESLEVIASGGSQPNDAMLQWAQSLDLGDWFGLDYQGAVTQVQYVWRSRRGQLHLFSAGPGRSYLVQTRRLASYLQAGLLVAMEDESLTVRATRAAVTRLSAEPAQLLD